MYANGIVFPSINLSVMFGVGEIRDQHGNVGPFRNMGRISNTLKYAIEEEAADVLDT
jgi:hypothetical protein